MDAESLHETKRSRDRSIGHDPHDHVHAFGRQRNEIPKIIVRGLCLRKSAIGFLFRSMDDIRKLDRILNKEHGNVVSHDVPIALFRIDLYREAAHIARQIRRAFVAGNGREAHEHGSFLFGPLKEIGLGDVGQRFVIFEIAMCSEAARVNDSLRDTLVIESERSFRENESLRARSGREHRS